MSPEGHGFGPDQFRDRFDVSRETLDRLIVYAETLRKWQPRINLVGPKTLDELWWRHVADSAQIVDHLRPNVRRLVDLGSGGGFPGLVLKAMRPDLEVTLIESDQRKAAFLQTAAAAMQLTLTVTVARIETVSRSIDRPRADVVTARALAPLPALLKLASGWMADDPQYLFLKGQNVESELLSAAKCWNMQVQQIQSLTHPDARLLCIERLARVET